MKLQVLCVCALLCAVACRSLDERRQGDIPQLSDDIKVRAKRRIVPAQVCEFGRIRIYGLCIPCDVYKDIMEEDCP
ncbi:hypothetical protein O3G_MSEX007833 [Manduca sexta]|uniref:Uncharacterized protein n=1 Tax=Manduca sexta TaxID=7130 RepID=A0A922CNJ6_MANSE|nr:hypothetical protein O3G_MSEX007833 [Manduca sexta]